MKSKQFIYFCFSIVFSALLIVILHRTTFQFPVVASCRIQPPREITPANVGLYMDTYDPFTLQKIADSFQDVRIAKCDDPEEMGRCYTFHFSDAEGSRASLVVSEYGYMYNALVTDSPAEGIMPCGDMYRVISGKIDFEQFDRIYQMFHSFFWNLPIQIDKVELVNHSAGTCQTTTNPEAIERLLRTIRDNRNHSTETAVDPGAMISLEAWRDYAEAVFDADSMLSLRFWQDDAFYVYHLDQNMVFRPSGDILYQFVVRDDSLTYDELIAFFENAE